MTTNQYVQSWEYETKVNRDKAIDILAKVKSHRRRKEFRIIKVDDHTWKEIEVEPNSINKEVKCQREKKR